MEFRKNIKKERKKKILEKALPLGVFFFFFCSLEFAIQTRLAVSNGKFVARPFYGGFNGEHILAGTITIKIKPFLLFWISSDGDGAVGFTALRFIYLFFYFLCCVHERASLL